MKRISKCGPREKRDDIIPDQYLQYNVLGTYNELLDIYIKIFRSTYITKSISLLFLLRLY